MPLSPTNPNNQGLFSTKHLDVTSRTRQFIDDTRGKGFPEIVQGQALLGSGFSSARYTPPSYSDRGGGSRVPSDAWTIGTAPSRGPSGGSDSSMGRGNFGQGVDLPGVRSSSRPPSYNLGNNEGFHVQPNGSFTQVAHQAGNALGPLSGLLGSASGALALAAPEATVLGVAAAPALLGAGLAAGVGYGAYKLGESFHLW